MKKIGFVKHVLSYIWDFTIEEYHTEKNGKLEVVYQYGKYILNSENANYSFQRLHEVFQSGLSKLGEGFIPNTVLNLGMGGGSTLEIIRKNKNWRAQIVSVEHDPVIVGIAQNYFNVAEYENHIIEIADAFQYVESNQKKYDLVIMDLFKDRLVPDKLLSLQFFNLIKNTLTLKGKAVVNLIIDNDQMAGKFENLMADLSQIFKKIEVHRFDRINCFVILH